MAEANVQELKLDVRKSFARIYSALKARELQTLRQIEAVWKQPPPPLARAAPSRIDISFDNEDRLFDEIRKFGAIDFKKLNLDGDVFVMEDYISPDDDHVHSYKSLDNLLDDKDSGSSSLEAAIREDALKRITNVDGCVCTVELSPDEVSKKFKEYDENAESQSPSSNSLADPEADRKRLVEPERDEEANRPTEPESAPDSDEKCDSSDKIDPTRDWLNRIIAEPETEPSQVIDLMEHSAIECS